MVSIVGGAVRVVETGDSTIDELAGNVATKNDRISIALVKISAPTSEPWLTLHYDEWMCVLKGRMVLMLADGAESLEVGAGQTVFIESGTRFRPTFPEGGTEYVPVCLPAFRPDRCIREDERDSAVSVELKKLHSGSEASQAKKAKVSEEEECPEVLYHVCQKTLWEQAKAAKTAYFPPTFDADGFTHATAVPSRLLDTANHFYQDVPGDWICLRFRRSALRRLGLVTKDERAMPVGAKDTDGAWAEWVCPHVFGGIPIEVVDLEYLMFRDGPRYTTISGLTDMPRRVFKLCTATESAGFKDGGKVLSSLDKADGFVHLSDRSSAPVVAKLFFKDCSELRLLEIDAEKLPGAPKWIVGAMDDAAPDKSAWPAVHYLVPNGCVHVFGEGGVPVGAIVREEPVPLGADGQHKFPAWL
mmetsp:Transcript_115748/g.368063  ORF Transcript_115748/g.368063 Transcript_115748/m.368063 type:complete len:415 (+) Transcript_115748:58-1302(+)